MDGTAGATAADVLNTYSAGDLARILKEYGEERFARQIARAVVKARESRTVHDLGPAGRAVVRRDPRARPAYRGTSRQAHLPGAADGGQRRAGRAAPRVPAAIDALAVGGRVVVESYHSLEDRLVKQAFAAVTRSDVPDDLPFVPEGHEPAFRPVTRGAEQADAAEVEQNPRAASVRLRAVERVAPGAPSSTRPAQSGAA